MFFSVAYSGEESELKAGVKRFELIGNPSLQNLVQGLADFEFSAVAGGWSVEVSGDAEESYKPSFRAVAEMLHAVVRSLKSEAVSEESMEAAAAPAMRM
jgi:hypothetical protein